MDTASRESTKKIYALVDLLNSRKICFDQDLELRYETYFKTGGTAKVYVYPQTTEAFAEVLVYCRSIDLEYKVVGLTSNVFFLNEIDYTVVITTKLLRGVHIDDSVVNVECGYSLEEFVRVMLLQHSAGYEGMEGIPGSIGGAIVMNAGSYGACIADNIVSVTYLNEEDTVQTIDKLDCNFAYRSSRFRFSDCAILSACFKINGGDIRDIMLKIEKYHIARHSYQEFACPNLGSLFSMSRNIHYAVLKRSSIIGLVIFLVLHVLLNNRIAKFIRRKRPQQIILNKLLTYYLKTDYYHPSAKNMNILCNNGQNSTEDMIYYIKSLKEKIQSEGSIENEIVVTGVFSMQEEFKGLYNIIQDSLS